MSPGEQLVAVGLVAWAMVLGCVVGLERAHASKAAGVRTNALVAGASAIVVIMGQALLEASGNGDATRSLHGVVTGIGFLGAGTIVHNSDGQAGGLTTAATIFTVAAVGCATGLGYPVLATGVTLLILIVLQGLSRLDPGTRARHEID